MPEAVKSENEFEIFCSGERTDSSRRTHYFSNDDLDAIAVSYDPALFQAPIIVSHDTGGYSDRDIVQSELAFGIVKELRREGDYLIAFADPLSEKVGEWIRNGQIIERSASFYPPSSPNNPKPGNWHLRHVALLGATPPAVKGMPPLGESFAFSLKDDGNDAVEFMMHATKSSPLAEMLEGMRDYLIDSRGLEVAEQILPRELLARVRDPDWQHHIERLDSRVELIDSRLNAIEFKPELGSHLLYQEKQMATEQQEQQVDFEEMRGKISALEEERLNQQRQIRDFEIDATIAANERKLPPGMLQPVEVSFQESGEGASREIGFREFCQSLSGWQMGYLKKFVTQLPDQIEYGEIARPSKPPRAARADADFDRNSVAAHEKILAYQSGHPELTYAQVAALPEFQELIS